MSGLIDSLKARRAGIAGMLNPGKSGKFGSGLLLNSSSLQPQTVFRQLKASFSVKRPSVTVMRERSLEAFSRKAESKYSDGMKLLHLRPASSSAGTSSTIQRAPASMPLPVSGGAAVPQPGNNISIPSSPASSVPSYPAQSERRPVVFDRSDGPSDFEKRLMAAKKQKQEQEAKQRGPDRRRVRTERVEISSSSSKDEVNRDFAPFDTPEPPVPPMKENERVVRETNKIQQPTLEREMADPISKPRVESQKTTSTIETRVARRPGDPSNVIAREFQSNQQPAAGDQQKASVSTSSASIQRESLKESEIRATEVNKESPDSRIQREPLKAAEPVNSRTDNTDESAEVISGTSEMVQREPLENAKSDRKQSRKTKKSAKAVTDQPEMIQRETLMAAEPVSEPAENANRSAAAVTNGSETIQREPLKAAELVHDQAEKNVISASAADQPELIQREPMKRADTVREQVRNTEQSASAGNNAELIQREPMKTAKPFIETAETANRTAEAAENQSETIQREPLKTAESVRDHGEKSENRAESAASSSETVQREPLRTAEPVLVQTGKSENKAESAASLSETVQREPLRTAEPVREQAGKSENKAESAASSTETVQREPLRTAEPVLEQAEKSERTLDSIASSSETVQREPLRTAKPVHREAEKSEKTLDSIASSSETVQREPLRTAKPVHREAEKSEKRGESRASSSDTIQREPLKSAAPIRFQTEEITETSMVKPSETIQREPLKAAEPVRIQTEKTINSTETSLSRPSETIQREPLKAAEPVRVQAEKTVSPTEATTVRPSETVQREPLKAAQPVHVQAEKSRSSAEPNESLAETIQREPLKTSGSDQHGKTNIEKRAEVVSSSNETVQREPIEIAKPVQYQNVKQTEPNTAAPEMVQRETLKTADPLKNVSDKHGPTMPVVQRLFTDEKTNSELIKKAIPVQNMNAEIQREIIQPTAGMTKNIDGINNSRSANSGIETVSRQETTKTSENTIQRDFGTNEGASGDDLRSLLSSLPKHYEMPKEQIEAIRSGKNDSQQNSIIQREYSRTQSDGNQQIQKNSPVPIASTENEVQRTVDFILPNSSKNSRPTESVSEIQREFSGNEQHSMNALPFPKGSKQFSGENSGNTSSGKSKNNYFPGVSNFSEPSGNATIQREIDTSSSDESASKQNSSKPTNKLTDEDFKDILDEKPKVTSRELEILADRLLPRIKRIMRSEMERSIFR